jgi:hypothetical protein
MFVALPARAGCRLFFGRDTVVGEGNDVDGEVELLRDEDELTRDRR